MRIHATGAEIHNLDHDCANCAKTCSVTSEVFDCRATRGRRRRGLIDLPSGRLYFCTDEGVKSARLFKEKLRSFSEVLPFIAQAQKEASHRASDYVHRLVHNLVTLNAQTIQAVYRLVPQDVFNQRTREYLIREVSKRLTDPEQTALLVIDLLKNANLEKTEIDVYAKLQEQEPVNRQLYHTHKIFMSPAYRYSARIEHLLGRIQKQGSLFSNRQVS